ncbi:MAG: hypothetical protein VCE12_14355, partial [Candidatus Latescibacterota bacterium]
CLSIPARERQSYPHAEQRNSPSRSIPVPDTFFIVITTVFLTLFLCSLTGYALARMRFPGRKFVLYAVLATTMVPFQVLLMPLFIVTLRLGLVDSYAGVILLVAVNAIGIFLMLQAFGTVPPSRMPPASMTAATSRSTPAPCYR